MNVFRAAFLLLAFVGPTVMVHAQITDGVCQPENLEIICGNDLDPSGYTITFDLINNSAFDLQKLVIPGTVGGVTISPNIYSLPVAIPPGGVASGIAFQLSGGAPGEDVWLPCGGGARDRDEQRRRVQRRKARQPGHLSRSQKAKVERKINGKKEDVKGRKMIKTGGGGCIMLRSLEEEKSGS